MTEAPHRFAETRSHNITESHRFLAHAIDVATPSYLARTLAPLDTPLQPKFGNQSINTTEGSIHVGYRDSRHESRWFSFKGLRNKPIEVWGLIRKRAWNNKLGIVGEIEEQSQSWKKIKKWFQAEPVYRTPEELARVLPDKVAEWSAGAIVYSLLQQGKAKDKVFDKIFADEGSLAIRTVHKNTEKGTGILFLPDMQSKKMVRYDSATIPVAHMEDRAGFEALEAQAQAALDNPNVQAALREMPGQTVAIEQRGDSNIVTLKAQGVTCDVRIGDESLQLSKLKEFEQAGKEGVKLRTVSKYDRETQEYEDANAEALVINAGFGLNGRKGYKFFLPVAKILASITGKNVHIVGFDDRGKSMVARRMQRKVLPAETRKALSEENGAPVQGVSPLIYNRAKALLETLTDAGVTDASLIGHSLGFLYGISVAHLDRGQPPIVGKILSEAGVGSYKKYRMGLLKNLAAPFLTDAGTLETIKGFREGGTTRKEMLKVFLKVPLHVLTHAPSAWAEVLSINAADVSGLIRQLGNDGNEDAFRKKFFALVSGDDWTFGEGRVREETFGERMTVKGERKHNDIISHPVTAGWQILKRLGYYDESSAPAAAHLDENLSAGVR